MKNYLNEKGMALTIVMVTLILLSLIAGYALNLSYNQHKLFGDSSGKRIKIYYMAQAGAVDAEWRIRTNFGANFTNPLTTMTYSGDVDGDGVNDFTVVIGAVNANGLRPIDSTGIDHYS